MEEVSENPNWRFILTTREYILNIARQHYEAFAHPRVDFQMCVINLSDYTRPVRAKILYNHIYVSDLPKEYKLARLEEHGYEQILNHRNYSPRVVEPMTQSRHARAVPPTVYLGEFVDSLENPATIWEYAYRHQISEAARHLLLVLVTRRDDTQLELVEQAFWKFYESRHKRFGCPTHPSDWLDALGDQSGCSTLSISGARRQIVAGRILGARRRFREHVRFHDDERCRRISKREVSPARCANVEVADDTISVRPTRSQGLAPPAIE